MQCNVCGATTSGEVEQARVRSNVRKFAHETFDVWRCPSCLSIHARDEVDLAHYYADYPFHKLAETTVDWVLHAIYRQLLSRLRAAGVTQNARLLDCSGSDSARDLAHSSLHRIPRTSWPSACAWQPTARQGWVEKRPRLTVETKCP